MAATRKIPFRPRQESKITQCYNDGIVAIYSEQDDAESGYMPAPTTALMGRLPYQERKLGVRRYYDAKMNQIHAERVIRIPSPHRDVGISNQNVAQTEDGAIYRIDLVQFVPDVYPPSLDLTLVAYSQGDLRPQPIPPDDEGGGGENA